MSQVVTERGCLAFHTCLLLILHLGQLPLQIVACTAMLPPATIPRFLEHFQMLSSATEIIRMQ